MNLKEYIKWCRLQGLCADIYEEVYPHTYLILWMECRRHSGPDGILSYPEPEKGYLQQDAEVMLAFEVLEELQAKRMEREQRREEMLAKAKELLAGQ